MKLPIEKQAASQFNHLVELGVPTRIAEAVSEMIAASGVKTASGSVLAESVKNASSMLCEDIGEALKIAGYKTPGVSYGMSEEEEGEDGLELATHTVKLAYAIARNAGASKEKAAMMAMHAHTRLLV